MQNIVFNVVGENIFNVFTYTGIFVWSVVITCGLWTVGRWIFNTKK